MACAIGPKCYHVLNWFFLPKPGFLGIYLNFQKSIKNQLSLPHSESQKSYQINSIKSCSSRSFQQHPKAHTPLKLWNFQLQFLICFSVKKKSFNIQELFALLLQVQTPWNQANAPLLLLQSFPKRPRTWSEASQFTGSHHQYKQNKTKQNKQTTFLHRW